MPEFSDKQAFVEYINNLRESSKGKWYYSVGNVCGRPYAVKGFELWLQVYRVDNLHVPTVDGLNVKQFKEQLLNGVKDL